MKEIMKDILIGSTFKAAEIVIAKNIIAKLLYHEYKVKIYYKKNDDSRKNQDFLVLLHGIYGKSSDMESIAQNFKDNYRIINIQYPTTKETAEEISDLYIEPNIENIKEQIFSENFHKKIENQYYEIDENNKVTLINGNSITWEEVKRNGFDYISIICETIDEKKTEIVSLELA